MPQMCWNTRLSKRWQPPASCTRAVLEEDPGHARASEGQVALLEAAGDTAGALSVRQTRAKTLRGDERHQLLCQVAESYDVDLDKLDLAEKTYREVLAENPRVVDGAARLGPRTDTRGRYRELLDVPRTQRPKSGRHSTPENHAVRAHCRGLRRSSTWITSTRRDALRKPCSSSTPSIRMSYELACHLRSTRALRPIRRAVPTVKLTAARSSGRSRVRLAGRVLAENLKKPDQAIVAYERVLEPETPSHAGALDALATLRAVVGDVPRAPSRRSKS